VSHRLERQLTAANTASIHKRGKKRPRHNQEREDSRLKELWESWDCPDCTLRLGGVLLGLLILKHKRLSGHGEV